MNTYRSFAVLLCAVALAACEKNAVQDITGPVPAARIKFFNFGVNAPAVNFYAGDAKMTAVRSTTGNELTSGVGYGGVAAGNLYTGITPGQYTVSGKIAAATDKDLPISSVAATIADGKQYSYYQSGLYNSVTKKVDAFIVEDPFQAQIDYSAAHVRFVNAIFNANPMTLYAKNQETGAEVAIGGAVPYKSAGAFTPVPEAVYDLSTRYAGSATNVMTRTGVSFNVGRVYTITARGDITVASTPTSCGSTNRTCLDNTTNR
jgi:hypothetical protein